jgi:hypothetical protein
MLVFSCALLGAEVLGTRVKSTTFWRMKLQRSIFCSHAMLTRVRCGAHECINVLEAHPSSFPHFFSLWTFSTAFKTFSYRG